MRKISFIFIGVLILMISSCASIQFTKTEMWSNPKIYNSTGSVSIVNDGVTELIPCTNQNYAIRATLKNGNEEKQVFLVVDTGFFQNILSSDVMDFFDNKTDSGYKFDNRLSYADSNFSPTKGYYFEKLESSGFVIDNILFQELPSDNLYMGRTVEGNKIDGVIGLCALRQLPFKFSIPNKGLIFYKTDENFPEGEKIQFNKKKLPFRLSTEFKLSNDITVDAYLDTGAFTSIVPEKKIRKIKYNNSIKSFEKVYENSTESYLVWKRLDFANQTLTNKLLYSRTGVNDFTVGTNILENYDFYINTKDGYGIFVPESKKAESYSLKKYINISGNNNEDFNFFGFTLDSYKIVRRGLGILSINLAFTSSIGQKFVTGVYYIDGKPVFTTVEPNDELVSINGIPCKDFDWNTYGGLQEADFVFKRGKKEIKLHASRQNYIGDETY
jgi:hypothetical protein